MCNYSVPWLIPTAWGAFLIANADALPNRYDCIQTHDSIVIDGMLNEPAWSVADSIAFSENTKGGTPRKRTFAWALWDSTNFYVGMIAYTDSVAGTVTQRDGQIWAYDCLEIMYDPDGDSLNYTELEWNCLNTIFDEFWKAPLSGGNLGYTAPLQSKITVQGTANKASDKDTSWTLEISIPWTTIDTGSKISLPPKDNDSIRINLFREDYSPYQLSAFSPTMAGSFHIPKMFGIFKFVQKDPAPVTRTSRPLLRPIHAENRLAKSKMYDIRGRLIPARDMGAGKHNPRSIACSPTGIRIVMDYRE
jgi:hypothetical protein